MLIALQSTEKTDITNLQAQIDALSKNNAVSNAEISSAIGPDTIISKH